MEHRPRETLRVRDALIGRVTMAKKKTQAQKPMCQTCAKTFDGVEAAKAAREGRAFIHECGRLLVRPK
jgi:ribosomal protein L34E